MVPLDEIIADARGVSSATGKGVQDEYLSVIREFGNEFTVLFDASRSDLMSRLRPEVAEGIMAVREGRLHIAPGFDGQYGTVKIFEEGEVQKLTSQTGLF